MSDFVHLHVHTEYSLLDGVNRTYELLNKAKETGMGSIAVTDHGVLYGIPEFWKASKDFGVKPIIGCEMYLAPGSMKVKGEVDGIRYYHLLLIAKNQIGYRNLMKMVSASHIEGMYYKPRIDIELLKKHSEGLICTSACLAGPISRHIISNQLEKAEEWLKTLHAIFKDDFYLEIQRNGICAHDKVDEDKIKSYDESEWADHFEMVKHQIKVNQQLYKFSDQYKIPIIATTDAHYLNDEDKDVQKILFCIKDGKTLTDPSSMNGYIETYVKTPEEMKADFSDMPEVLLETVKIAEKIEEFDISYDRVQPKYNAIEKGFDSRTQLRREVFIGAHKKYKDMIVSAVDDFSALTTDQIVKSIDSNLAERLDFELTVIHDKGYDDYFLVVSDIMKWADRNGILTGVRGSVAGSAAAFCLEIVGIDPIGWELYFERFLNPERPSPPDIDMDIQDSRRDELIKYVQDTYGENSVAAICAIGRLKTKAAIRDIARVMAIDLATADKLSKMVQVIFGKNKKFKEMMEIDPEFARIVNSDEKLIKLGKLVSRVEGLSRHMSVHACGYLITPGPITDYAAIQKESRGERVITQWEGPWIEELGLMKFDFLGLRTLSIVSDAIKYIKQRKGVDISFWDIPNDDAATYELFAKGETIGVFQFESPPMQKYLVDLKPTTQEDLCFMAAAYRPGPMKYIPDYIDIKHGRQKAEYIIPELKDIVGTTNGFAIYQEQVIKISVELGGYSMGGADMLRRAMGKKKVDVMAKEEVKFKTGVVANGYSQEIADKLWEYMLPFADYGFNKAHAAGYAVLAYKCAYLKAHYTLEFMTALFHADLANSDRIVIDMKEAKRLGFNILPPSINHSDVYFIPEGTSGIRFGLGAIKNVGLNVCNLIIEERLESGEFTSLDDLVCRVGPKNITKKVTECLIKSGALDEFGDRSQLIDIIPQVYASANTADKQKDLGMQDMFMFGETSQNKVSHKTQFNPSSILSTDKEKTSWEKDLLGIYITNHPLTPFAWTITRPDITLLSDLKKLKSGENVQILGMFSSVKVVTTKKDGSRMAIVGIEDLHGSVDGVLFPRKYEEYVALEMIQEGRPFIISGKGNMREDKISFQIDAIEPANSLQYPKSIIIDIRGVLDVNVINAIKSCIGSIDVDIEAKLLYGSIKDPKEKIINIDINKIEEIEKFRPYIKS